jgi:ABC-type polysaccharide/polyol phosphate export permease
MREVMRKAGAIFVRDARIAFAYPLAFWTGLAGVAAQPLSFYFLSKIVGASGAFGFNGSSISYFEYVAVNLAFLRFQSAAMIGFQRAVRGEQMMGTIESVLVTPTGISLLITSSGLFPFALTFVQIALFIGVSLALGLDLSHTNVLTTLAFALLTMLAMSPIGIFAAASIMSFKQELPTGALVGGLATLLGGVLFPVSKLPPLLQQLAWFFPITHSLNGIRAAVAGASLAQTGDDALWLAVVALILFPLSLYAFARSVRRAKIDGTLGEY